MLNRAFRAHRVSEEKYTMFALTCFIVLTTDSVIRNLVLIADGLLSILIMSSLTSCIKEVGIASRIWQS